ncbi:PVC-type heme-binding CxxCH protein [Cyclobacterium amurskyense]|uniref:Membrane-bound dehydrogenase domain protein n=1 Tax=Cyclobacterium amurskyense TaxID=320787 RepID=A0A0H4PGT1_9BACT|nr:PVC-type heme-binding CxxCH protein [Cyclobacterium amurskyense]AKP53399.1 Membrane-bound dehydrogenase domain protein [Cyclobacterium amurskyense]
MSDFNRLNHFTKKSLNTMLLELKIFTNFLISVANKASHISRLLVGIATFLIVLSVNGTIANAQNALRDIPSTDPQVQMDRFQVADGFEVNLFATDPMVVKPIQMNWDAQGRLWVVSSTIYPHLRPGETANDKILVIEDTDRDGIADKSTVFAEGLFTPTGLLPGDGGVYVANSTEILHLKDTDGDGKADERTKILSGFGTGDTHHLIHTFRWGPDGLMYFNQSIYIYSHVETPWGIRRLEGGGVWQYNTKTQKLEVYAKGLINPWGLQFDKWGKSFLTDGAGREGINYAFPGATFVTAPGAERILSGLNPGQPKHSGLDIVSGAHMPEDWAGSLITNDFRANRVNRFVLEEQGSGFVSKQADDLLWTDHIGFRPVDILMGPDGAIYVADWYNPIIQHGEVDFFDSRRDQQHGRIWRVTKKDSPLVKYPDLQNKPIPELLEALKSEENWVRLQAKLILKNKDVQEVKYALSKWLDALDPSNPEFEHHLMEGLWMHQAIGAVNVPLLEKLLTAKKPEARAAAIRVLVHWKEDIPETQSLLAKATKDSHATVRLEAVVGLQNFSTTEATIAALEALDQTMDVNLDFALWHTINTLSPVWLPKLLNDPGYFGNMDKTIFALNTVGDPKSTSLLAQMYSDNKVPEKYLELVREKLAKYGTKEDLTKIYQQAINPKSTDKESQLKDLELLYKAASERGLVPQHTSAQLRTLLSSKNEAVEIKVLQLVGMWKKADLLDLILLKNQDSNEEVRKAAMEAMGKLNDADSQELLFNMAKTHKNESIRILAISQLVKTAPEKATDAAITLLSEKPSENGTRELFAAFLSSNNATTVFANSLSNTRIPTETAKTGRKTMQELLPVHRRTRTGAIQLKDALEASGGVLPPEKMPQQLSEREIYLLGIEVKTEGDPVKGEAIYRRASMMCQNCHGIGGAGGQLGPDLSSLGTSLPIDNIIKSILEPTESIKEGFELQKVTKNDGGIVMGYLINDGAREVVIRDMAGNENGIPKSQIKNVEKVPGSLMPAGITASLEKQEFINLVSYLSKLGSNGDFRVTNEKLVRRWKAAPDFKALSKIDGVNTWENLPGKKIVPGTKALYSKVAGDLPLGDIPVITDNKGKKFSLVQFEVNILKAGEFSLKLTGVDQAKVWVSGKEISLNKGTGATNLSVGKQWVNIVFDRDKAASGSLMILIEDGKANSAQSQIIVGQ